MFLRWSTICTLLISRELKLSSYLIKETQELVTVLDFLRFSLSCAMQAQLHYGHGTDNAWDDMRSLILRSLHLPYDVEPSLLQWTFDHG